MGILWYIIKEYVGDDYGIRKFDGVELIKR